MDTVSQVVGYDVKENGDIFVEYLIADGDVLNKSVVNGLPLGYATSLLEKWQNEKAWVGCCQNAHPTGNHPLVFSPVPPAGLGESGEVEWFKSKSADWGFANYVSTRMVGKKLYGTIHITDENAKKAWRAKTYPKFASSSVYIKSRNPDGIVTDGIPIASTCVKQPSYPIDVAGIHNECHGGFECVHKIAESGYNCNQCKEDILSSFENLLDEDFFSSNSKQKVSESSMSEQGKPATDSSSGDMKPAIQEISKETRDSAGNIVNEGEEAVDYKTKYEELLKEHKKTDKDYSEYKTASEERFMKLERSRVESKIREILAKVPKFVFDGKDENREAEVKKYVKRYDGKNEDAIIEDVNDKYLIAIKVQDHGKKVGESGIGESGISNFAPLVTSDGKPDARILKAHEVFG